MYTFVPSQDKVVIKRSKEAQTTETGIIIPISHNAQTIIAEVVSIGPYKEGSLAVELEPGDKVLYVNTRTNYEMKVAGEDCEIINLAQILGKVAFTEKSL
jgi:co-chaperonin GroES (HSP10)